MRINNNLMAMNTHRQLGIATTGGAKSMEKLSSGFRINRAGDDAAGLAISEKMRGQIRGLTQASRNAQDGISMIQTAEGALNETHAILQRMRELAVQSATDTNTADDRAKVQAEVDQLASEISRISNTTEFNTKNLLAGGLNNTFHVGANQGQSVDLSIGAMDAVTLGVAGDLIGTTLTAGNGVTGITQVTEDLGTGAKVTVEKTDATFTSVNSTLTGAITSANVGTEYTGAKDVSVMIEVTGIGTPATGDVNQIRYSTDGGTTYKTASVSSGEFDLGNGMKIAIANDAANNVGNVASVEFKAATATVQLSNDAGNIGDAVTIRSNQSSIVVGDASTGRTANVNVTFGSLPTTSTDVAITQTKTASTAAVTDANGNVSQRSEVQKGINISTQYAADKAITTINNALENVSEERGKLGAMQNRLEHTIKNLDTSAENLQASEARIRDVDMAKEMMEQTKQNILQQASTAMLAQANQAPQGVLQLLR